MRARGDKPATVTVDVEVNGAKVGSHTFTPESVDGGESDRADGAGSGQASTRCAWSRARSGAGRGLLDGHGALLRQPRIARAVAARTSSRCRGSISALTPVTTKNGQHRLSRDAVQRHARSRATCCWCGWWRPGRRTGATSMLEDPLPAGVEAVRGSRPVRARARPTGGTAASANIATIASCSSRATFDRGRYEYTYLLKIVTPGIVPRDAGADDARCTCRTSFATTGTQTVECSPAPRRRRHRRRPRQRRRARTCGEVPVNRRAHASSSRSGSSWVTPCSAAIYWGFLNVPESNVLMLLLSALLALAAADRRGHRRRRRGLLWLRPDWTFRAAPEPQRVARCRHSSRRWRSG